MSKFADTIAPSVPKAWRGVAKKDSKWSGGMGPTLNTRVNKIISEIRLNGRLHWAEHVKDMPKKSGDYLAFTDLGWPLTFFWDAKKRAGFYHALRNHYDAKKGYYVSDGKVDGVRMDLRHLNIVWCGIDTGKED